MANVMDLMPELMGDEQLFVSGILRDMDDKSAQQFVNVYRMRRKDPQTVLLLTLVGFLGFAGIQRFILDQIGMGILYFFTGGLCLIGTIIDLVNYRKLAFDYNRLQAHQVASLVKNS